MFFQQHKHKNLIVSMLVASAILAVGIAVNHKRIDHEAPAEQSLPTKSALAVATSTNIADRDSDADGLPDWEEHLYNSDSYKFDTDGDGTSDGQEVREGRNPTKKNTAKKGSPPNDAFPVIQDPNFATSSTDILGIKKDFFAKFLAKESTQIREQTYKNLLNKFDAKKVTPNIQLIDLNISSDNSKEALHEYGNAFGVIINKYTKRTHRTEQEILKDAMKSSSTPILRELQLPAVDYRNFSNDLKALKTPSIMAKYQLKIVSGYAQMSMGLLAMQSLFNDPIVGAGGYEAYSKGKADVTEGYAYVVVVFAKENVSFAANETGAPFYYRPRTAPTTINNKRP